MHRRSTIAVAVAAAAIAVPGALSATAAQAATGGARVAVANAQPQQVRGARATGTPRATQRVAVRLYLAGQSQAALAARAARVSNPSDALYHHYLTPAQVRAAYAPSTAAVQRAESFLKGAGLSIGEVPSNRAFVTASGTVAAVQKAFGTTLRTYTVGGHAVRAAATAPTVPAALQHDVLAVSGLASVSSLMTTQQAGKERAKAAPSSARRLAKGTQAPPPEAFVNAGPCSTYASEKIAKNLPSAYSEKQPYAQCGQVPAQLQGAYGLTRSIGKGFDGRGVTVAITDAYAAPTIAVDANTYATRHGQKAFAAGQLTQSLPVGGFRYGYDDAVNGDQCGEQGWYGEETLDVEAVHAVAPGATVQYVAAASCDNADFAEAINRVVAGHLADVVTNSWGGTDESNGSPELDKVYAQIFYQAALEGIGYYFSSGDSGDGSSDNDGTPTVQSPANSPLVTAVGGTALAVSKTNGRVFETGWSTGKALLTSEGWTPHAPGAYQYGGGGGTSRVFKQPGYQQGVVPAAIAQRYAKAGGRALPDVAALGDPNTGMLVGETQTFPDGTAKYSEYRIGGTSLASPLFAGVMAIADQVAGFSHGFANPALYQLAGTSAVHDITHVAHKAVVRVDYANGVDATDGTITSLRSLDDQLGTTIRTRTGYDDVTGIGSPNGEAFISALLG
ncbi:S53 family peptidase [Angustibacter aerolatus]